MPLSRPQLLSYERRNLPNVASSYWVSPSTNTASAPARDIALAVASCRQYLPLPLPPSKEGSLGSQATSPAAATSTSAFPSEDLPGREGRPGSGEGLARERPGAAEAEGSSGICCAALSAVGRTAPKSAPPRPPAGAREGGGGGRRRPLSAFPP